MRLTGGGGVRCGRSVMILVLLRAFGAVYGTIEENVPCVCDAQGVPVHVVRGAGFLLHGTELRLHNTHRDHGEQETDEQGNRDVPCRDLKPSANRNRLVGIIIIVVEILIPVIGIRLVKIVARLLSRSLRVQIVAAFGVR